MRSLSHWLETFTPAESLDFLREMALSHALLGGSTGEEIARLIRRNDITSVCLFEIDPSRDGWVPEELYHCRQAVAFFSKLEDLEIGIDKEEAAWKTFQTSEALCKSTNEVFRAERAGRFHFPRDVAGQLHSARNFLAKALGDPPSREMLEYRFGKGATTLTKKRVASIRAKLADGAACSEELLPSASAYLGELPVLSEVWANAFMHDTEMSWYSVPVQIMDGKLEFVPKNAKTYRGTVTEPPLNVIVQLAWGDWLFNVCKRVGLDLRDQTRNQRLAREGSLTGALATSDLTSASDCNATELVYDLLPLEWAHRLAQCRTGHVTYKGQRITLEKFSSMGNGFTFPLETLIFWSLARSVCSNGETVSVYGDDIILPSHRYLALERLLTAVGFLPNRKKSYYTGRFRESCGADFYSGIDVRPYFQKKWISYASLYVLHNFYVRRGRTDFAERVLQHIPSEFKVFGPDGFGDGHLIGDYAGKRKPRHVRAGYAGHTFDTFAQVPRKDESPPMESDKALPALVAYRGGGQPLLKFHEWTSAELCRMPTKLSTALFRPQNGVYAPWPVEKAPLSEIRVAPSATYPEKDWAAEVISAEGGWLIKAVDLPLADEDLKYRRKSIYTW